MTNEQAQRLRVLMQEVLELVLGRPIAFVLVGQDEERNVEVITNAANREALPALLKVALELVQNEPAGTTKGRIPDHRAAGESADASAPGMECSHAAAQAPAVTGNGSPAPTQGTSQPAPAAVSERCRVTRTDQQCEHQAAGGLRLNLYATPTIQKRYGRRVMLSLIFDLPVCSTCMPTLTLADLVNAEQWKAFSKVAQQRNAGVLVDRAQTEIVLCKWDEPEYVTLRNQIAQRAANDSHTAGGSNAEADRA